MSDFNMIASNKISCTKSTPAIRQHHKTRLAKRSQLNNIDVDRTQACVMIVVLVATIAGCKQETVFAYQQKHQQFTSQYNTNYMELAQANTQLALSHQQALVSSGSGGSSAISTSNSMVGRPQAPLIAPFAFDNNVQEGHRTSILCSIARGDLPLTIRWLKDGQLLSPEMAQRITIKSDTDSSTLKFKPVRLEDAGNYTCEVDNRAGSQAHTAELLVHSEPRWLHQSQLSAESMTVSRGATVVIDCQAIGWPKPNQTWSIKTHSQNEFQLLANDAKHFIAPNGSLVIKNASKQDEANYLCKAHNGIGRGIAWSTALKVNVPAYFESNKQQTHLVRKHSQIQLRCDAHGDEPLTIEWFKDKQRLTGDFDARYTIHSTRPQLSHPNQHSQTTIHHQQYQAQQYDGLISVLIIKQAQRQDNSLYECVTRNQAGRDKLQIELIVQEEPDNIQAIQAGQISPRSVTLVWSEPYDGKSAITSYIFQLKRVNELIFGSSTRDDATSLSEMMEQQMVMQNAQSSTQSGSSQFQHQLTTAASSGQQPVVDLDSTINSNLNQQQQMDQDQLMSSIKQTTIADDWQQATRIQLPVHLISNASASPASLSSGFPISSRTRSYTIERLEPSSKYVLRAVAINNIGQSKFSQPFEFVTHEDAPEVGPSRIKATAINSTSILVSWDELLRGRSANQVHGYYVGYRVAASTATSRANDSSSQSAGSNFILKPYIINDLVNNNNNQDQSHSNLIGLNTIQQISSDSSHNNYGKEPNRLETILSDLKRNTVYEITINAFNSQGSGPPGELVVCKTIEMEAPKPVKLLIKHESNDSLFLEWHPDPSDQNPVDDYVIYQERNGPNNNKDKSQFRLPGNQTQYKASGLKCGNRYQFYVIAQNRVGKSRPSELVSGSTIGKAPLVPSKFSLIKMINSTCLEINLNAFQDNGCRLNWFTVRYRTERIIANGTGPQNQQQLKTDSSTTGSDSGSALSSSSSPVSSSGGSAGTGTGAAISGSTNSAGTVGAHNAQNIPGDWQTVRPRTNQNHHPEMPFVPFQRLAQANAPNSDEDKVELLCNLNPSGEYTIHVAATNDVGRSEIEYTVLMSSDELKYSFLRELGESFAQLPNLLAYIPSIIVFLLAGLFVCLCALILYTTAIRYYQKFIIMQNQIRATKRAKTDERRRRKLNNNSSSSRANLSPGQNKAELWAEDYEQEVEDERGLDYDENCHMGDDEMQEGCDDDDDECGDANNLVLGTGNKLRKQRQRGLESTTGSNNNNYHRKHRTNVSMLLDEDEANLTSSGSSSANSSSSNANSPSRRIRGRRCEGRRNSMKKPQLNQQHLQLQFANRSQQFVAGGQYRSNLHGPASSSAFDSSSIDSSMHGLTNLKPANGRQLQMNPQLHNSPTKYGIPPGQTTMTDSPATKGSSMSTASIDSIHGPFQCLSSKQYVKMNEYTMMPSVSASISQAAVCDIYGISKPTGSPQHQHQQPTMNNPNMQANVQRSSSLYYSTLRNTSMQTYLPPIQRHQQQQLATRPMNVQRQQQIYQAVASRQAPPANDIYGYHYVSPKITQAAVTNGLSASTHSSSSGGVSPISAASTQQQDEVANSIFVPPQQQKQLQQQHIIYSAPNVRHHPSVFL